MIETVFFYLLKKSSARLKIVKIQSCLKFKKVKKSIENFFIAPSKRVFFFIVYKLDLPLQLL